MPGIVGILSPKPAAHCAHLVSLMTEAMMHESFYVSAHCSAPEIGVYGGTVAFDETWPAGSVHENAQRDVTLLLSGESAPGGDELIRLYEERDEQVFEKLNGLFSGLLIDRRRRRAFLFNDRFAFNRIYIHESGSELYFASEAKALLRILPHVRAFSDEGVADYLAVGCATNGRTLFRGIHLLPPASAWMFDGSQTTKAQYFNAAQWESQPTLTAAEFQEEFETTFRRVLPAYFASPSRVGVSLTAGLDTRMVMACRPDEPAAPISYTYDGPNGETLDTRLARRVAQVCGMPHEILRIEEDFFARFAEHAERTVFITDGAFGVLGAHEIYLSSKARKCAPTRLTGVFGSEIMRGVSTFNRLQLSADLMDAETSDRVAIAARQFQAGSANPVTFAAFAEIPWNIFGSIAACSSQLRFRTPYLDNAIVSLAYRAPAELRSSSGPAVRLVQRNDPELGRIPTDMGLGGTSGGPAFLRRLGSKVLFKLDYLSNEGFPHVLSRLDPIVSYLNARKWFLGHHKYLRYRSWLKTDLSDYLRQALAEATETSFFDRSAVGRMAEEHIAGHRNWVRQINAVLTLRAVERTLLNRWTTVP